MALSFAPISQNSIAFETFVEKVDKTVDSRSPLSLQECVAPLQELTNNDSFLTNIINTELSDLDNFQKGNAHSVQSLMLHRGSNYYIRLNAWPVLSIRPDVRVWQEYLYQYLKAHDHNFWFLTAGYFGLGYETEIWEYDHDSILGFPGEKVEMKFLEKTSLPKGKAMLYRASTDIHCQYPPLEFSMSLNIMLMSADLLEREQFYFDTDRQEIIGNTNTSLSTRYLILELASKFGDNNSAILLENIAKNHKLPHVRMKGYQALAKLKDDPIGIWEYAQRDGSRLVKETAKANLSALKIIP
ncbi:hypothetical protein ACE38W_03250 [Chitinophaga sp. Hz27]|uniref:hypothetical protein n=1 Tax=Chitinophaga sp. Hz27 TaxID=3347169 RepID=UPI0035D62627